MITYTCRILALNVIKNAITDFEHGLKMRKITGSKKPAVIEREAHCFLSGNDETGLNFWCELADIEPWMVKKRCCEIILKNAGII